MLRVIFLGLALTLSVARGNEVDNDIARLEKDEVPFKPDTASSKFSRAFNEVCSAANEAQCLRLAAILSKVPPDSYFHSLMSSSLLSARLRLATEQLRSNPPKLTFAPITGKNSPPKISADLAEALKFYYTATKPYGDLVLTMDRDKKISYQTNKAAHGRLINSLLSENGSTHTGDFTAYTWGYWCGTGSDSFLVPNSLAICFSLLREKRFPEALGAALQIKQGNFRSGDGFDPQPLIALCVPDWEKLVAGALVEKFSGNPERLYEDQDTLLQMLGMHGGEKSALRLIELISLPENTYPDEYIRALGAFLSEAPEQAVGRGDPYLQRNAASVSPATQQKILALFDRISGPDGSFQTTRAVAKALKGHRLQGSTAILYRLLQHPSEDVVKEAANSLSSLGETFTLPSEPLPFPLQIQLNGKPLNDSRIIWSLGGTDRSVTDEKTTSLQGIIFLPRKHLLDPALGDFLCLTSGEGESPEAAVFFVDRAKPKNLKSEEVVKIETKPLRIRLELPQEVVFYKGQNISVTLQKMGDRKNNGARAARSKFVLPVSEGILFSRLQPGEYYLQLDLPGAGAFRTIIPNSDIPVFDVKLQAGADVRFHLSAPEGWITLNLKRTVIQNGKEMDLNEHMDYLKGDLVGMPYGDYVLRIPSSREQEKNPVGKSEDAKAFETTDIPFKIDAQSPAIINLGEIRLKALPVTP